MNPVRQLQAYKDNRLITEDPGTILLLLYQGAIDAVNRAIEYTRAGDMAEKGRCILRAHDIITQFAASLDHDTGGDIAQNLDRLYDYMLNQLLIGNVNNDCQAMQQVSALLGTLREGWDAAVAAQRNKPLQGAA